MRHNAAARVRAMWCHRLPAARVQPLPARALLRRCLSAGALAGTQARVRTRRSCLMPPLAHSRTRSHGFRHAHAHLSRPVHRAQRSARPPPVCQARPAPSLGAGACRRGSGHSRHPVRQGFARARARRLSHRGAPCATPTRRSARGRSAATGRAPRQVSAAEVALHEHARRWRGRSLKVRLPPAAPRGLHAVHRWRARAVARGRAALQQPREFQTVARPGKSARPGGAAARACDMAARARQRCWGSEARGRERARHGALPCMARGMQQTLCAAVPRAACAHDSAAAD